MAARWPAFYERFDADTPFQSVASFPPRSPGGACLGALDLYSTSPDTPTSGELEEVHAAVAVPIASTLFRDPVAGERDGLSVPNWLKQESVDDRMNVWVAVGMSMQQLTLTNSDALALLRGYAYAHSVTLDQVARLVTDRGLQPEELTMV